MAWTGPFVQLANKLRRLFISKEGKITWQEASVMCAAYQLILLFLIGLFLWKNNAALDIDTLVRRFSAWDGEHYLYLSRSGYPSSGQKTHLIAFFPLYPLLIRILTFVFVSPHLAGLVVSSIGSIVGHSVFMLFLQDFGLPRAKVWRVMLLLFCSPIAVYFSNLYSEGMYLALSSAFLLCVYRYRFLPAAVVGALAAVTRPPGVLFVVPYLVRLAEQASKRKIPRQAAYGILILSGFFLYLGLNLFLFGDPFHFLAVQGREWHKHLQNPFQTYLYNVRLLFVPFEKVQFWTYHLDLFSTAVLLLLFPLYFFFAKERLPMSLILWAVSNWLLFCSQSYWLSNMRFIGLILPLYVMLEELTWRLPVLYWAVLLLSVWGAVSVVNAFSMGGWIH